VQEMTAPGKPMTKVEAVMQPSRFAAVKDILMDLGVEGITISDVRGHGRQRATQKTTAVGNTRLIYCPKLDWRSWFRMIK